jgi:O-antigen ligase
MVPHESITSLMRRTLLLGLDTFLLYYVFSRTPRDRRVFREVLVCVVLSAVLLAPMAIFESLKGWLLYSNLGYQWGTPDVFGYLWRSGLLRAQVSTGHALYLGYLMLFGIAIALYLRHHVAKGWWSGAVLLAMVGGLVTSLSRGPMLAALLTVFVLVAMGPKGGSTVAKLAAGFAVTVGLAVIMPFGDELIDFLPFVGSVNAESVDYRTRLLDTALILIPQNLLFGDPFVLRQMEHLRQGQGIIDLVNGYILVALYFGMVGLTLFVGLLVLATVQTGRAWVLARKTDLDLGLIGASLFACMLGTVLYIFTTGFYPIHYILIGLMLTYSRLRVSAPAAVAAEVASAPMRRPFAMAPMAGRRAAGRASSRRPV